MGGIPPRRAPGYETLVEVRHDQHQRAVDRRRDPVQIHSALQYIPLGLRRDCHVRRHGSVHQRTKVITELTWICGHLSG
jgi:hypothetical protein